MSAELWNGCGWAAGASCSTVTFHQHPDSVTTTLDAAQTKAYLFPKLQVRQRIFTVRRARLGLAALPRIVDP